VSLGFSLDTATHSNKYDYSLIGVTANNRLYSWGVIDDQIIVFNGTFEVLDYIPFPSCLVFLNGSLVCRAVQSLQPRAEYDIPLNRSNQLSSEFYYQPLCSLILGMLEIACARSPLPWHPHIVFLTSYLSSWKNKGMITCSGIAFIVASLH
jgi:hypothetical protein